MATRQGSVELAGVPATGNDGPRVGLLAVSVGAAVLALLGLAAAPARADDCSSAAACNSSVSGGLGGLAAAAVAAATVAAAASIGAVGGPNEPGGGESVPTAPEPAVGGGEAEATHLSQLSAGDDELLVGTGAASTGADAARLASKQMSNQQSPPGGSLEHLGDDLDAKAKGAVVAAATAAFAPVVAVVAVGEELLDAGKGLVDATRDAAKAVAGALDDLFGGGDGKRPGESTFPTDGEPTSTKTPEERARERQAWVEEHERLRDIHDGAKEGNVENAATDHFSVFRDEHRQLVGNLDDGVERGASFGSGLLDPQAETVGSGASGAVGAPDGVKVPVEGLRDRDQPAGWNPMS